MIIFIVFIFVILFVLYIRITDLERKVHDLTSGLKNQTNTVQNSVSPSFSPVSSVVTPPLAPPPPSAIPSSDSAIPVSSIPASQLSVQRTVSNTASIDQTDVFTQWLAKDLFLKVGAFLLLLACVWFVSYAFANNWIGPVGRIMLGLLFGISVMMLGMWRIRQYVHQGEVFAVLGSTILILAVFAGRVLYEFFTPLSALLVMFLSVCFITFLAVSYRRITLAHIGFLLGAIIPLLLGVDLVASFLLAYIFLLVIGTLWVMYYLESPSLLSISFIVSVLFTSPYFDITSQQEMNIGFIFVLAFSVLFLLATSLLSTKRFSTDVAFVSQVLVTIGNGIYTMIWIQNYVSAYWQPVWYGAFSLLWAVLAFGLFIHFRNPKSFIIHGGVAGGFLIAATASLFTGPTLTLALIAECGLTVLVTMIITRNSVITSRVAWLLVLPIALGLTSVLSPAWSMGLLHGDFIVLVSLISMLYAIALLMYQTFTAEFDTEIVQGTIKTMVGVASVYLFVLVWLVYHAVMPDTVAVFFALTTYIFAGLYLYIVGVTTERDSVRKIGALLIGLVVLRLLVVDVWNMPIEARIITFAVIGVILIATAFIKKFQSHS